MRRFQNKIIESFTAEILDNLGADGWELVSMVDGRAYLKRELTADDIRLTALIEEHKNDPPILAVEPIRKGERVLYLNGGYRPATEKNLCNPMLNTSTPYIYATKDVSIGEPVPFSFAPIKINEDAALSITLMPGWKIV